MKNLVNNLADLLDKLTKAAVALLLTGMVVIIFLEIIFRYILKIPMVWSEQTASYIMIWLAFLSSAIAFRQGAHIGMTLLSDRLKGRLKKAADQTLHLLVLVFLLFLAYWGFKHAFDVRQQHSPVVFNMSMSWAYLALPVGAILMIVQNLNIILSGTPQTNEITGD